MVFRVFLFHMKMLLITRALNSGLQQGPSICLQPMFCPQRENMRERESAHIMGQVPQASLPTSWNASAWKCSSAWGIRREADVMSPTVPFHPWQGQDQEPSGPDFSPLQCVKIVPLKAGNKESLLHEEKLRCQTGMQSCFSSWTNYLTWPSLQPSKTTQNILPCL